MTELDGAQTAWVWRTFAQHVGPKVLLDAYGWDEPPMMRRPGERVFGFFCIEEIQSCQDLPYIGWGSITKNPLFGEWWHSAGVFPQYQRRGLRLPMRNLLVEHVFKELDGDTVTRHILDTNRDYYLKCIDQGKLGGTLWPYRGHIWAPPPGYAVFSVTKSEWEAAKLAGHPEAQLP